MRRISASSHLEKRKRIQISHLVPSVCLSCDLTELDIHLQPCIKEAKFAFKFHVSKPIRPEIPVACHNA